MLTCLALPLYGTLCFFKVVVARESGGLPECQPPIAALSTFHWSSMPRSLINFENTASAIGERQMFPNVTHKRIFNIKSSNM